MINNHRILLLLLVLLLWLLATACSGKGGSTTPADSTEPPTSETKSLVSASKLSKPPDSLKHIASAWTTNWDKYSVDYNDLISGGPPRDGIPSIDQPQFIPAAEAESWLKPQEPVISVELHGEARAYPLQILTWHEIVNDTIGKTPILVTFCPLCNAAIVFDRKLDDATYEFGVSGLLRYSDMIMYDRTTESLWQQLTGEGVIGDMTGKKLTILSSNIISFAEFQQSYPKGMVLSRETGYSRSYGDNPYVGYDRIDSSPFLFDGKLDDRLLPMERVITVSFPSLDAAYPLKILENQGVIHDQVGGQDLVVFHRPGTASALDSRSIADGKDVGSTGVYYPILDGDKLTFNLDNSLIVDQQTKSTWNVLGHAVDGPLKGKQLTPIVHANHFWFAWAAFKPDTIVYK